MATRFRICPRVAHYQPYGDTKPSLADTEAILFLPDLTANAGKIAFYALIGEHGEADIEFYLKSTSPPDQRAVELYDWYVKNKCDADDKVKFIRRIKFGLSVHS